MDDIDVKTETVFLLSDGVRIKGVQKSYRSLYRYVTDGVPVMDRFGRRVVIRLAKVELPTGMATSVEAYYRFIEQLTVVQATLY